jgi:hypothetical protein
MSYGGNFEDSIFEDGSFLRRIEAQYFSQYHMKTICILPLVEELCEHCFYHTTVGTQRIGPGSELGRMKKGYLKGCSVMSIENSPRFWRLASHHAFVVRSVDDKIRSGRRIHILAFCEMDQVEEELEEEEEAGKCIRLLATG